MPSLVATDAELGPQTSSGVTKFTNCLQVKGNDLVKEDLWVSSVSGKILNGQELLFEHRTAPDRIVDLGGRILSPGFIDTQLNGAYGFDFSVIPDEGATAYGKGVLRVNRSLIATGVTSYLPTMTSQRPEVYHEALPYLGPSGAARDPSYGSESLGAHCEGPFMNPTKNGIHNAAVLREPVHGISDMADCYGAANIGHNSPIKLVTLAPELSGALSSIQALTESGIRVSIGHSEATYEEAKSGIKAGASMITHLFNAMRPLHHRNPGIFGLLGTPSSSIRKPYFGIIADGIHLHPTSVKIAWNSHPDGLILVTDAMRLAGMPDGTYDWTNGSRIIKQGPLLTLEENGKIAGSSIQLVDCVTNFLNWTDASVPEALKAVTETPAKMLGMEDVKGALKEGADADLVVLDLQDGAVEGEKKIVIDQVWKFGKKVFDNALKD
ncbi:N-acetylglucosamine-6-phosphate deacetylase [Ascochyta rabiei]|uniref:N-acetylglucosamine-6-phosphate deacetylase n=1 Tax=Didymella rabiei TaxID=5454 RepID=A0A163M3V1_DIDRA|nr:N-acetylglucosamine-6-phosphate deacetylase [Ascochyta rabiei]KZM28376.1 N-acetylglucosamine-6-phosphate deacetylase [Ascochyta rabiei]UPX14369.1 N-acetylglucosamine-6-phosphate deacetylase [Ascochyta rabiei]